MVIPPLHHHLPAKLLVLFGFLLLTEIGFCQGTDNSAEDLQSLNNIPFGSITTDSIFDAAKAAETTFLESGDTIRAFEKYALRMYDLIYRSMSVDIGLDFEPYLEFASHHEAFREHPLYYFFNGFREAYRGSRRKATEYLLKSESSITSRYPVLLGSLYFELSSSFLAMDDHQGGVDYALKFLESSRENNFPEGMLSARLLLATGFAKQNRYDESARQHLQALQLAKETNQYGQMIHIYVNSAINYRKQKKYEEAYQAYEDAYNTIDTNTTYFPENLRFFKAITDLNIMTLWNDTGKPDSVITHFEAIVDSMDFYQYPHAKADALVQAGRAFYAKEDWENAVRYLQSGRDLSREVGSRDKQIEASRYLSETFRKTGRSQDAIEALEDWIRIKKESDSISNSQLVNSLQMRYESDRQLEVIAQKEAEIEKEISERKATTRKFIIYMLGFVFFSGIFLLWRNKKQLEREKQIEIDFNRQLIAFQESENLRVSKELHDGVGQSLMMIKNKVMLDKDEATARLVGDTLEEIRNISRQLHPFTLQKLGLSAALEKLLNDLDETTGILVDQSIDRVDDRFTEKAALNIFRIVQENLNNVMKHSEAKALEFSVKARKNHCRIILQDNGKGFDVSENFNTVSSLGLKTMKERTSILKGQIIIDSEKGRGTRVDIKIPYDV